MADPTRARPAATGRPGAGRVRAGGYRACWGRHRHLDVYRCYRADVGRALGMACSLKAVAALAGLAPVEVDAARVHVLDRATLRAYVASDAACTRRAGPTARWANASAAVDRVRSMSAVNQPRRRRTSTSSFGVGRREGHDATAFYERFPAPVITDDDRSSSHRSTIDEPFRLGDSRHLDLPDNSRGAGRHLTALLRGQGLRDRLRDDPSPRLLRRVPGDC